MGTTVVATFSLVLLMTFVERTSVFFVAPYAIAFLLWTLSQGALGACAFLCVSATVHALKERSGSTTVPAIDVTDENILSIRVILGALFALLIALPIGGRSIVTVYDAFLETHPIPPVEDWITVLVPFMFGFSTPLVLAILNRIVGGIGSLFGVSSETTTRSE
jgi:hypothetical protein